MNSVIPAGTDWQADFQEWFKPFLEIIIPIGVNRNQGIHEYPSKQAYSEILRNHMAE